MPVNPANMNTLIQALRATADDDFDIGHPDKCVIAKVCELAGQPNVWHDIECATEWLGIPRATTSAIYLGRFIDKEPEDITREDAIAELERLLHKHWFDRAYTGLAAQGWAQSVNDAHTLCAYHVDDLRCAVGHMIDPHQYRPEMDGTATTPNWTYSDFQHAELLPGLTQDQFTKMQSMHDLHDTPEGMKAAFDAYRQEHHL